MKGFTRIKKLLKGRVGAYMLLAAGAVLLLSSAAGSASAALTYYSDNYTAQVVMDHIGVTLVETSASGTKDISSRDYAGNGGGWEESTGVLLEDMLKETDGKLQLGRAYKEAISVKNSGDIDAYVRVKLYKYWTDGKGEKIQELSPALIGLDLTDNGWIVDTGASTEERTVLYWPSVLKVGETTLPLSDTLTIDPAIASKVTTSVSQEGGSTWITTTFNYDGAVFHLEAQADAVQTHNGEQAIQSAWGVDVNISDSGTLSLSR